MNILIACEFSGVVRDAFRELGHNAWSCDILPCDGDKEYHIQGDVLELIKDGGRKAVPNAWSCDIGGWNLLIAHPPCTYLCNSGVSALKHDGSKHKKKSGALYGIPRWEAMYDGCQFFNSLKNADIAMIAIENPIPHRYARGYIGRYTQVIQPWMFGHKESKATCLWLKGLPKLSETDNVKVEMSELQRKESQKIHWMSPGPERAKKRSITFTGIGKAMAEQWGR